MDLVKLPSILRRWRWVLISIVVVVTAAVALHVLTTPRLYEARVRLQVTDRLDNDVAVLDTGTRPASTLRDDLTLFQNNFVSVVSSDDVRKRTQQALHLDDRDAAYRVSVSPIADSNFVDLLVSARSPDLARAIADTHAAQAIRYYGELRAKPAGETMRLIAAQLPAARQAMLAAGAAEDAPATTPEGQVARATYQTLLEKYAQASLAEENAARVTYVQIAQPATVATPPAKAHKLVTLGGLALVGSLGLGLLAVMLLEACFPRASAGEAAPSTEMTNPSEPAPVLEAAGVGLRTTKPFSGLRALFRRPARTAAAVDPQRLERWVVAPQLNRTQADAAREVRVVVNGYGPARTPAGSRELGGHLHEWQGHYHRR